MRRLIIEIDGAAYQRLVRLAVEERRPVRDQAAIILECALGTRESGPAPLVPVEVGYADGRAN